MIKIESIDTLNKIIASKQSEAIIFYKENCPACDFFFKNIERYYYNLFYNFYMIDINLDIDAIRKIIKMPMFFPETRIYRGGVCIWRKSGVLFDLQIKELIQNFKKQ